MKILLVLGKYLPEKNGGIENYSHYLATILLRKGYTVNAAILQSNDMQTYSYEGVKVIPLKNGFKSFNQLLHDENYDICHLHEYSAFGGIELFWIKEAKQQCKKVFFTFHLPYLTCYKSDFRYMGIADCSNFSSPERCVQCIVATKLNYKDTTHFNLYNAGIDLLTALTKNTKKIRGLRDSIISRQDDLNELLNTCDKVFIIADWFKEILSKNGYTSPALKKIRPIAKMTLSQNEDDAFNVKKKILFAGRIEKQKGLLLLCKAMNLISNKDIQLDVFGNRVDEEYFSNCIVEYAFNYNGSVPRKELLKQLHNYDFLILPSVFTEMYSMILQEALYEKLPVIASTSKGNIEMIKEGRNGFLFEYDNYKDLAKVIDQAYTLKRENWQPVFEENKLADKDNNEILAYY